MNKYHSSYELNNVIKNNISKFIEYFNLNLISDNTKFSGPCPIHFRSDNPTALTLYRNSGVWRCNTHHCEETFGKTATGFIKALISSKELGWQSINDKDKVAKYDVTLNVINKILNNELKFSQTIIKPNSDQIEKYNFIRQISLLKQNKALNNREHFRKNAAIPAEYYLKRGFSESILDKYDVGVFSYQNHEFFNRVVVPIYDINYKYIIGYTARSLFEKCLVCNYFHDLNRECPEKIYNNFSSKWQHSKGFKKENSLYNYWFAKNDFAKNKSIILVEGPSHCWRLAEAGFNNSIAIFGSSLSTYQSNIIKRSNINNIIILSDNDDSGQWTIEQIKKILGKMFNYSEIYLDRNDIAEYNIEEVKEILNGSRR